MQLVKIIPSILFFIVSAVLCGQIIFYSLANQKYKTDYAELNNITYGLLSIDAWNRQVSAILVKEINKLNLLKANQEELRKHIEAVLTRLADGLDKKIRDANSSSLTGRMKQSVIDTFINLDDIKKDIPEYADIVLEEMTKSETVANLKIILIEKLKHYSRRTFDAANPLQIGRILRQTGSPDIESAKVSLAKAIADNRERVLKKTILLIMLVLALFLTTGFSKKPLAPSRYILLVLSLILLLVPGVTTPMIDMEAKISHLGFVLMGHYVQFENQVLYFQSKSILNVFRILIFDQDSMMKFVGILLITFSIFFPLLKILSTMAYYYNYRHAREDPIIAFFVLKSGKWSMADVMVVAVFMAYIGFNGIISNQLDQLRAAEQQLDIVTTNGTSLQPGYYLFLAYCLLGLFLSEFLTRKPQAPESGGTA